MLGQELGVSGFAVTKWRDGESSPERKHLDSIAAHPLVGWTSQQLDLYLDGQFDHVDIEDLLNNGIPEEALPLVTVKQALKKYNQSDRLEVLAFLADLLRSGEIDSSDINSQKKINNSTPQKSIKTPRTKNRTALDNRKETREGDEKMSIELSRLADLRLRPLLRDSLTALGFDKDYRRAALSVCDTEEASILASVLEHLISYRFEPRLGYPQDLLNNLAALCCEIKCWLSDDEPNINPKKTYRGEVERFLLDLEKPLNNHNHCGSAK
jgi:hypothetical protein